MAATLTVLTFTTIDGADEVLSHVGSLQKRELIKIHDAAVVRRGENGKPKIQQARNLVGEGALGGAFWGMLIGLLFLAPWLGAAIGAATGGFSGKLADFGIDDSFVKEVGDKLSPGTSALFVLTTDAVVEKVAQELQGIDFEITHTSLPPEQEAELRSVFADAS